MLKTIYKLNKKNSFLAAVLFAISFTSYAQNEHSQQNTQSIHQLWNSLLAENVETINNGHSTEVNYAGIQIQREQLTHYLDLLAGVTQTEFDTWQKPKQLAFLINAYNAWTVELIVSNLASDEHKNLKSIRDLGSFFSSPWSKEFIPLLGKKLSLDDIEHGLIRGAIDETGPNKGKAKYNEPRIHFAVNCASIGCPAIREEAYTAEKLEAQLEQQTIRFLSDSSRNFAKGDTLNLSSIFKWYRGDFENGYKGAKSLSEFTLLYAQELKLSSEQQKALKNKDMDINFTDYNWDLNALN